MVIGTDIVNVVIKTPQLYLLICSAARHNFRCCFPPDMECIFADHSIIFMTLISVANTLRFLRNTGKLLI